MANVHDHDLKVYVDAVTYLALRYRCSQIDRSLSEHVRHLIRQDLLESMAEERETGRVRGGEGEGKE